MGIIDLIMGWGVAVCEEDVPKEEMEALQKIDKKEKRKKTI